MARPSVIPQVCVRLEAYLNEREMEYQAQPADQREPTLPATPDGKVSVRAVAQAVDLKVTQEKYLYERQLVLLVGDNEALEKAVGRRTVRTAGFALLPPQNREPCSPRVIIGRETQAA